VAVYPALFLLGLWHVRSAERTEERAETAADEAGRGAGAGSGARPPGAGRADGPRRRA
jgi:hypothetical protein